MSNPIREVQAEWLAPIMQQSREFMGLSMNKAAEAANLAPSPIMRIENGTLDNPSLETINRLCLVYERDPADVIPPLGSIKIALAGYQDAEAD